MCLPTASATVVRLSARARGWAAKAARAASGSGSENRRPSGWIIGHTAGSALPLVLAQEVPEPGVAADAVQVAVLHHEREVAVAQLDRPPEFVQRLVVVPGERQGAGQVVPGQGV